MAVWQSPDQATVRVRAWHSWEPDGSWSALQTRWEAVPLPDDFAPAATGGSGTDQDAILYQPSTGRYWEFWMMEKTGQQIVDSTGRALNEWGAAWGGRMDNIALNSGWGPPRLEFPSWQEVNTLNAF